MSTNACPAPTPELVVHNLPVQSCVIDNLPEFAPDHALLSLDPTACAARCVVTVLPTEESNGKYMIRTRLAHALRHQMHAKFFSVWWCVASSSSSLERCLLEWCDALEPSNALTLWSTEEALNVLRRYPEQQRAWGKCCVLVLDECTNDALHAFISHWCSRWGLHVVVLGQEPIDIDALRVLVPASKRQDRPTVLPLGNEDASAFSEDELSAVQFQTVLVPQLLNWVDDVRAFGAAADEDDSNSESGRSSGNDSSDEVSGGSHENGNYSYNDDDDEDNSATRQRHDVSYMNKAAALLKYKPVLLRFCAVYMQLKSSVDTYTVYHGLKAAASPQEEQRGDYARAAVRLIRQEIEGMSQTNNSETPISTASSGITPLQWFDAISCLPLLFPRSLLPRHVQHSVVDVYLRLGVITILKRPSSSCGPLSASDDGSHDFLKVASWFKKLLLDLISPEALAASCSAVVMRCTELSTLFPADDDVTYHRLHEQLLVDGPSANSKHYAAGRSDEKRAQAAQYGLLHCSNPFLVELRHTQVAKEEWGDTSARRRDWHRWSPVIIDSVSAVVQSRRLFVEVPVLFPPRVCRPFRDLFGVPPLPMDAAHLTPQLAQLFRLYAKAHAGMNDFVSAAAAVERALCIYLGIFEEQAQAATSKFAELLMPRIQDPQLLRGATMTRRQSTLHKDATRGGLTSASGDYGTSSSSLHRKMSRTGMGGAGGASSGVTDGAAFSHCFSLIALLVEESYHEAAGYYVAAGMAGIAESLIQRSVAMLELLNNNRRDTPGRAVNLLRRAEILLSLGQMEEKRGSVIKHADYLDEDTSDMKLRERVKADVESRTYFRKAAAEANEALAALGLYKDDFLLLDLVSYCEKTVARQQLVDYEEAKGLQHAELSLEISKIKLEMAPVDPPARLRDPRRDLSVPAIVLWAHQSSASFVRAIQLGEYSLAHEMLDRTPLLAVLGYLDGFEATAGAMQQVIAVESEAADFVSEQTYPTPRRSEHLHLLTTFSDVEIASHHGRCWQKKPRMYCLPAHELLLRCSPDDQAAVLLLHRLLSLGYDPRSCSPHDMRTLLHIAVDRNLHEATQCLLKHPLGDVMYTAPYMLASQRVGLSTVPVVAHVANQTPCALYSCKKNPQLLLVLLFESNAPAAVFEVGKAFIVEELAADRESGTNLRLVLGKGAPFEGHLSALLLDEHALAMETKQELAKLCGFKQVEAALAKTTDPYFITVLCDRIAQTSPSAEECTRVLVTIATRILRSASLLSDNAMFSALMSLLRKYPSSLSEETLYWDDVKTLERRTGTRLSALLSS